MAIIRGIFVGPLLSTGDQIQNMISFSPHKCRTDSAVTGILNMAKVYEHNF